VSALIVVILPLSNTFSSATVRQLYQNIPLNCRKDNEASQNMFWCPQGEALGLAEIRRLIFFHSDTLWRYKTYSYVLNIFFGEAISRGNSGNGKSGHVFGST
jgi:hypothetical protein